MVEKMEFKKKEKRKYQWKCAIILISAIIVVIGYMWALFSVPYPDFNAAVLEKFRICSFVLMSTIATVRAIVTVVLTLITSAEETMNKNIAEFEYNAKVDEFLNYLGDKELKARAIVGLPTKTSRNFKNNFLKNTERVYYVRKNGPDRLYIWTNNKKGEEKWNDTCDYGFFFDYFEPIYEKENEV